MDQTAMTLDTAHRGINRRLFIAGSAAIAISGGQVIRTVARQATPPASPSGNPEAVQLLNDAATAMTKLETFAFEVVTARGETTIMEGFTLQEISGVVRRPTDFETTVTVEIPFASIDLTAVSIAGEIWIELPAFGDQGGGWQSLGTSDGLLSLLNPDILILEAVRYIEDAAIDDTGDLDGVDVTFVTGSVDFRSIATRLAGDETALANEIAEGPVDLTVAIDVEQRIREIEIIGPLLSSEAGNVIRLVTFSSFNEPVEISQPEV
ncbi:MAG TPA: LppX_LprAFG lipoprotein [Thermomicrobiales bacterium]|nr:LppX_LprAFG lipoprotein [Thermomicrobiales bacterium]